MLSDAIAYDDDGVVRQIHSKQLIAPEWNCVMSFSGSGPAEHVIRGNFTADPPHTFDEAVARMPDVMRRSHEQMFEYYQERCDFMLLIGGWSDEHQRYRGFYGATLAAEAIGYDEPFSLVTMTQYAKPNADALSLKREGISDPTNAIDELGAAKFGLRLMLAQRTSLMTLHNDGSQQGYGVGGFCQMTILQRDHISSRIMWRWPDEIGRKVEPEKDPEIRIE